MENSNIQGNNVGDNKPLVQMVSVTGISKFTHLTEPFVSLILKDKIFTKNMTVTYRNGNPVEADIVKFKARLKEKFFKKTYGYENSGALYNIFLQHYPDIKVTLNAFRQRLLILEGLAPKDGGFRYIPLNVTMEGTRTYRLYSIEKTIPDLSGYAKELKGRSTRKLKKAKKTATKIVAVVPVVVPTVTSTSPTSVAPAATAADYGKEINNLRGLILTYLKSTKEIIDRVSLLEKKQKEDYISYPDAVDFLIGFKGMNQLPDNFTPSEKAFLGAAVQRVEKYGRMANLDREQLRAIAALRNKHNGVVINSNANGNGNN